MELSKRLHAVANLVTPGAIVADVGCDHGYISIYLVKYGISKHVIALDVNAGPLQRAKSHISQAGYEWEVDSPNEIPYIETRLSDGMKKVTPGEVNCVLIAGMGGPLMVRILSESRDVVKEVSELILQPQSDIGSVRKYLRQIGFTIVMEDMVVEDGKYYPMMKAAGGKNVGLWQQADFENEFTEENVKNIEDVYGPVLLQGRHPVLHEYLLKERKNYRNILKTLTAKSEKTEAGVKREQELKEQLKANLDALNRFGGFEDEMF